MPSTARRRATARGTRALLLLAVLACGSPPTDDASASPAATDGAPAAASRASGADAALRDAPAAGANAARDPAGAASRPAVAFVDVNVVPMTDDWVLPHQTVIVQGDRIVAVGAIEDVQIPTGAARIDGAGLYLMPGLADMHVHVWNTNDFALYLANGVTTVRNMFGAPLHLAWKQRMEAGELLGPTIVTAGPILDGNPPIWNTSRVVETADDAREAVREQQAAGYDVLKVYSKLSADAYHAIAESATEAGMPFAGHVPPSVPLVDALAAGQVSIEHLTGFGQALTPGQDALNTDYWHAMDDVDLGLLPALADEVAASDTWICPTLVVFGGFARPAEVAARLDDPVMAYVDPTVKAMWNPETDFRFQGRTEADYEAMSAADAVRLEIVRALHAAGAKLLLGTDTLNPLVVPGFAIHQELALLVEAGLSPYDALATGTVEAARFLGQPGEFGVVAPGARADLLLLRENPLHDVANVAEPRGVMVRGVWLPEEELQRALGELAEGYSAPTDRFAEMPAMPAEGERLAYELTFNDSPFASERARAALTDDGSLDVTCQLVYDAPVDIGMHLHALLEPGTTNEMIDALVHTPAGEGRALIERRDDRLRITGTGLYAGLDIDEPIGPDVLLRLGPMGIEQRLLGTVSSMVVGETADLARMAIDFDVELTMAPALLHVERRDDEVIQTAQGEQTVMAFTLTTMAVDGSGSIESSLYLDDQARAVRFEQIDQMGVIRVERTE